jgi:hypothetical protein
MLIVIVIVGKMSAAQRVWKPRITIDMTESSLWSDSACHSRCMA